MRSRLDPTTDGEAARLIEESGADTNAAVASATSDQLARLRELFDSYNELVRRAGDVPAWEREWFVPDAQFRPIEDRDWFSNPEAITRAIVRWMETWDSGTHHIDPVEVLELGDQRFLVTAHNVGVGRHSGVPIEALTYMAMRWRGGKLVWFDEYFDKEAAVAAFGDGAQAEPPAPTLPERVWKLCEAAFAAFVRQRSDGQLERLFGSSPAQRAIFKRMEQLFEPEKVRGFKGEIQCELPGAKETRKWVIRIDGDKATTRAGEAPMPAKTLRARLPVFVRIAARELHPLVAFREGDLEVSGDFDVATRIEPMFGLSPK
jgi:SCP-2 sterol transfer family